MPGAWIAAGTAVNVGMNIIGGGKAADAAHDAAVAQEKAAFAKHQYDLDMWDMKRSQLQAERQEAVDGIMLTARNQGQIRAYQDAAAIEQYDLNLKIRNSQQAGNEAAFARSEDIFDKTTTLNNMAAKSAMDSNIVALQEQKDELAYEKQNSYLDMLVAEGQLRARGVSGRSIRKGIQSTMADYGREIEMLNATDDSLERNTRAVLDEIIQDKLSADLTAYAQRMLDPGVLPMPIKPVPQPIPELSLPRVLSEFDFGALPIKGFSPDPNAASQAVWGQTLSNIGGAIGQGAAAYAGTLGSGSGSGGPWTGYDAGTGAGPGIGAGGGTVGGRGTLGPNYGINQTSINTTSWMPSYNVISDYGYLSSPYA